QNILFHINVQHDCSRSACAPTATRPKVQEHEATTRTIAVIEHHDESHFIVTLHALHNGHLIR
ncbi:hypothetical protein M422DRAFT_84642, partial [Sphaerobolus stellatus SS14]